MAIQHPVSATLFAYQVGFGDCFLLRFTYPGNVQKHLLIDFGTTGLPKPVAKGYMITVAQDIAARCGGKLDAVVATHRHEDHVSGFATGGATSPGQIIRDLKPEVVIQPWTEKLSLAQNSLGPKGSRGFGARRAARTLASLQRAAANVVSAIDAHPKSFSKAGAARMRFIGEDNISNVSAVKNLSTMGKRRVYTYHEGPSGLEKILPGVKTHVLGPPTLNQTDTIRKQRKRDPDEFWHLHCKRLADGDTQAGLSTPVFPHTVAARGTKLPGEARWFANRLRQAREEMMMGIVTALDDQMNNTSLILLFETKSKKLLFPGDAQIENWAYALSKDKYRKLVADVDLYKVGHHGSLNATPRSMWTAFAKRGAANKPGRLKTVMSTLPGKHGDERSKTEVPRESLLTAMRSQSDHHSTHTLPQGVLFTEVTIDL
jgi:hypothetical protein